LTLATFTQPDNHHHPQTRCTSQRVWRDENQPKENQMDNKQSYASGHDYFQSGSPRCESMSEAWLAGWDAAAAEHREYAQGIELP
jgi:hypothetical protein